VLGSPDTNRVGARRILACPHCHRLLYLGPEPVPSGIACRGCHRVVRINDPGADDRGEGRAIVPEWSPRRIFIDRRPDPSARATPSRRAGGRLREMLGRLRSTAIALLVLAAAAAAVYVLLAALEATHDAARRSLLEGSMTTTVRGEDGPMRVRDGEAP
jgi:hypothetical protein